MPAGSDPGRSCNQPTPEPIAHVALPSSPFAAIPTSDGCWIFVSLQPMERGEVRGIAVVKRTECLGLYSLYEAATREYLRTVEVLHSRGPQFPPKLYDDVKLAAENARIRSEAARIAKELHVATHLPNNDSL